MSARRYRFVVVIESIREFNRAVPRGSFVIVFDPHDRKETPHHISALLIERASLLNSHKRGRTRKR
jgi:hypothetical protein